LLQLFNTRIIGETPEVFPVGNNQKVLWCKLTHMPDKSRWLMWQVFIRVSQTTV